MKSLSLEVVGLIAVTAAILPVSAAEKFNWTEGHGDIAINYVNGGWQWHIEQDRAVEDVIVRLTDSARREVPENAAFSFLGPVGAPIWIIPASQSVGIPYVGINSQATASGVFANDRFELSLSSVHGPGDFFLWTTTGTGTPSILMNSGDGISVEDKTTVPAGGHTHANWGFSLPGTYQLGFKASGFRAGEATPVISDEAVFTFEVGVLKNGEADIEIAYEAESLEFHIHDHARDAEFDPAHVAFHVAPGAWQTVPQGAGFSFLGQAGESIYVLPQRETEKVLFLGLAAAEIENGVFLNDQVSIEVEHVDGPGAVAYYETDEFGTPRLLFSSADGVTAADRIPVLAGTHAHRNWSFSEPGDYRITLQATGTLVSGTKVSSVPATFFFQVKAPEFVRTGEIDLEILLENGAWDFVAFSEAADQALAADELVLVLPATARQEVPTDPAFGFLGSPGGPTYVLPQHETAGGLFLGIAADEIEPGVLVENRLALRLISTEGPGDFALYLVDDFGKPTVFMNTRDGVAAADVYPIEAGGHAHLNWAFSQPGEYKVTFEANGTLTQGTQPNPSARVTLRFLIETADPIDPGPALSAVLASGGKQLQLIWQSEPGVSFQLQTRASVSQSWVDHKTPFPGQLGLQTALEEIGTDSLKLFRLVRQHP